MAFAYQFLEHVAVADLAFDASGDSMHDLFRGATTALMEAMANPATVGDSWSKVVDRADDDPAALLFDWLSDLIFWKDADGVVYSRTDLALRQVNGRWTLQAVLYGEPVNPSTQELRADVKGVTKHLYRLAYDQGRWTARVVLDV